MDVKLPDGTIIRGVPEGTTKSQLAQKLQASGRNVPQEWLGKPEPQKPLTPQEQLQQAGRSFQVTPESFDISKKLEQLGHKAGEATVELGTKLGLSPEVTAGLATAADVGIGQGLPMLAGGGIGAKAAPLVKGVAEGLMRSSLKPILSEAKKGNAARAVKTLLEEGVNVTEGGVKKLRGLIDDLNQEIKQRISSSSATVSKKKVADYLDDLTDKFKQQVNPQSDLNTIQRAYDEFMNHPGLAGKMDIPVSEAQKLKTGTYKVLGQKAYGEMKGAEKEAQKTLARGLKEEIAKGVPEIAGLNKRESELLNALNLTERRVLVSANKNPAGLAYLAKNPQAAAAFMADRSELFKSLAARLIYRHGRAVTGGIGAGVGAVASQPTLNELQ